MSTEEGCPDCDPLGLVYLEQIRNQADAVPHFVAVKCTLKRLHYYEILETKS